MILFGESSASVNIMNTLVRQWQFNGAGVATAFAAKDVMGNMLCGVGLQFSRPFSIGDFITVHFITIPNRRFILAGLGDRSSYSSSLPFFYTY